MSAGSTASPARSSGSSAPKARTAPVPPSHQAASKAQGSQRYQGFIETLGRRLQRGDSLVREISQEIWPDQQRQEQERDDTQTGRPPESQIDPAGEDNHAGV
jgi:hypothetical protein